jgi:7-carboxy-7-deazaguanine synthase
MAINDDLLVVSELFLSLQGEARDSGWPTTFIRLSGCPLRCHYCDTQYAYSGGDSLSVEQLVDAARVNGVRRVCLTGGEPLAQPASLTLMTALCDAGFSVSLETSGALPIDAVDRRVSRVVDLKTPGSGEVARNHYPNLDLLVANDQLKVVIRDRNDYNWAGEILIRTEVARRCDVIYSPVWDELEASELAGWILADRLPVRMQIQLHKLLWGEQRGR